jgi:hypothetical protein
MLLVGGNAVARALKLGTGRIDITQLLKTAAAIEALNTAELASRREALQVLLDTVASEAELSLFGYHSLRWDIERMFRNALRIDSLFPEHSRCEHTRIVSPIFIFGLPRSGSTFLHRLLAIDPDSQALRYWQTFDPAPRPPDFDPQHDARVRKTERMLSRFKQLVPALAPLHPLGADLPQECTEITAHTFQSLSFDTMLRIPSYRDWLDRRGHDDAYIFHRRFLVYLQHGLEPAPGATAPRWILKCPDHIFAIDALLKIYPDARFVITHRNPLTVIPSVARLTQVLREPFSRHVDPALVGAEVAQRWIDGAHRLIAFDRRTDLPATRVFHLHYDEFISNPAYAVERLYQHFKLPMDLFTLQKMKRFVAHNPRGGYGLNHYALETFDLDRRKIESDFHDYCRHFQISTKPRSISGYPALIRSRIEKDRIKVAESTRQQ